MDFKEFLTLKRKQKGFTLRGFAKELGISPAFLSDLESGNRVIPANSKKYPNLLNKIISTLKLDQNDTDLITKLADESMLSKDKVSIEVRNYLQNVPLAQQALRKAQQNNISNEEREEFIKLIERKK